VRPISYTPTYPVVRIYPVLVEAREGVNLRVVNDDLEVASERRKCYPQTPNRTRLEQGEARQADRVFPDLDPLLGARGA